MDSYEKVDPEEIIEKLRTIIEYLKNKRKNPILHDGENIPSSFKD